MERKEWKGDGFVKAVPSGDTLVLMSKRSVRGPPPEIRLTLSGIQAPKLGRTDKNDNEAFAWHSREFLRSRMIGKDVKFIVQRSVQNSNRKFGTVILQTGQDLRHVILANGWATIDGRNDEKDIEALEYNQEQAKGQKKGIWQDKNTLGAEDVKRNVASPSDPSALFERLRDKKVDSIIEYVRDGSSFRVQAILDEKNVSLTFNLAGIACPRLGRRARSSEESDVPPEAFSVEAKHFVEVRLLHRRIPIRIKMLSKSGGVFIGEIIHPKGDIGVEILKRGLGRVVDWSVAHVANRSAYVEAEKQAKQDKLRMWKDHVAPKGPLDTFEGRVVEIVSGDTVVVANSSTGVEERVSLSSVRTRRMGARGRDPEPFAFDAREHLRHMLIGKPCKVVVEYERKPQAKTPGVVAVGKAAAPRRYATVTTLGRRKNAAVSLVMQGLAEPVRHRQDDPRSVFYAQLLDAEIKAKRAKRGLHGPAPSGSNRVRDLTQLKGGARKELPALTRAGRMKAIVEYVFSGGRFKLRIPDLNCMVMFALCGLRCPARARRARNPKESDRKGEPMAEEAFAFSRTNLLQRNVTVLVEDADKSGTVLGSMFAPGVDNVGVHMLSKGLARIVEFSADRSKFANDLYSASEAAREARSGVWQFDSTTNEDDAASKDEDIAVAGGKDASVSVKISEVVDGQSFYVHRDEDASTFEKINEGLKAFALKHGTDPRSTSNDDEDAWSPKKGALCAALFGAPPAWYRAEIVAIKDSKATVAYVDFGNRADVALDRLRPLDADLASAKPLALSCKLAFVDVPTLQKDYGKEAAEHLGSLVWDASLKMRVVRYDAREKFYEVLLFSSPAADDDETDDVCVNKSMLASGYGRVDSRARLKSSDLEALVADMREAVSKAHQGHIGIYRYGDPYDDDDDGRYERGRRNGSGDRRRRGN